jgi:hypothetical protein
MNFDFKKAYYYIIALITFFVLLWGVIDFASATTSLITGKYLPPPQLGEKSGTPGLEDYYQQRMAQDRMFDSLARILVAGAIFGYAQLRLRKLEKS